MTNLRLIIAILLLVVAQTAYPQEADTRVSMMGLDCGSLENHYGPFDYTNPTHVRDKLPVVEKAHFNGDVESLNRGKTAVLPGGDLDYTLRAFPNHHRALYAMARYAMQYPKAQVPPGARYSGHCYFRRAVAFKSHDAIVRVVYGIFYSLQGNYDDAIEQLEAAIGLDPANAEAHYNIGLMFEKTNQIDLALSHAKTAYELGFPLNGLKNKLRKRGVWDSE